MGIIVETESYLAEGDSACHAAKGKKPKNEIMFGQAGIAYVYPIHAKFCFNVVTEEIDRPSAVLIRAIEPVRGIDVMGFRRGTDELRDLTRGPARLCQACSIDRQQNGLDLTVARQLWIASRPLRVVEPHEIRITRRIGVTSATDLELRFLIDGCPFVSGPKR
jgi:DNA-3-methyladenine glycosylase